VAVLETLDFYFEEESHASMRDHPLRESALSLRSLSVHDDLRILIQRRQDGGIYLLRVGDHATVYRNI
jgi:mRNA-degrading endonuclease YafQ of YafQ-DinJ toxin-antitoxin module